MNILLIAPQPYYQERGTPIAVSVLLRALSERGDRVDVLTYHEGREFGFEGVKIHRIPRIPGVRGIRPGFSLKKLICDAFLLIEAIRMLRRRRYDLIHAVEEAVHMAVVLQPWVPIPYVYDMDSSLAEQLAGHRRFLRFLHPGLMAMEARAARKAMVVLAVCRSLVALARQYGARQVVWLPDISLLPGRTCQPRTTAEPRANVLMMYTGNLEPYQGIQLMLEAFHLALSAGLRASLAIVGGRPELIRHYRRSALDLGIGEQVRFYGPRPVARLAELLHSADILVSPRIVGRHTPMKIASYLHSGRAILATRLPMHTQVLSPRTALLCAADPTAMARAMGQLAGDPALRGHLGREGCLLAEKMFTYAAYKKRLDRVFDRIEQQLPKYGPQR